MPTTLIKRQQGSAEAFQKVSEPGEMAGCSRWQLHHPPGKMVATGDAVRTRSRHLQMQGSSTKSNGGGTLLIQNDLVTRKRIPRSLRPFHAQIFKSTHELGKGQLAQERARC